MHDSFTLIDSSPFFTAALAAVFFRREDFNRVWLLEVFMCSINIGFE
jgi:drug/metabolite transporter (DMT)-like permease